MRRTALICSLLLSLAGSSFAAAAEELPNYATQPAVVSTSPAQPAEPTEAESSIDTSQAEEHAADNNIVSTAPTVPATPKQEETAAEAPTTVNEAAPMAEVQILQLNRLLSAMSLCHLQTNPSLNQSLIW